MERSGFFAGVNNKSYYQSVTRAEVNDCINRWQEEATRYHDRLHGTKYNKVTSIPVMLNPFMAKLKQFSDKLDQGYLNSKQLHDLARLLKPLADSEQSTRDQYDYRACKDLISKMKPLIYYALLPDYIFNKIVRPVFDTFLDHTDEIVFVYTKLIRNLEKIYMDQAEIFLDKMLNDDPKQFYLFAKALTANSDSVLGMLNREQTEENFKSVVNKCIEGMEHQVRDYPRSKL